MGVFGDVWDWSKKAAGDAVGAVGDSLGRVTGADGGYERKEHKINADKFGNEHGSRTRDELIGARTHTAGRQAPQATAAQRSAIATYGGAQIANNERSADVRLGPAAQGSAVKGYAKESSAAQINRQDEEFRRGQTKLVGQLQEAAEGRGPSLATMQLRQATDRNVAQQMGASAALGGNSALALRNAANNTVTANRQAGIDSAHMKVQEQLAARQQLGSVLAEGRGQDINVNTSQAGFNQQTNLANQSAHNQFGLANMDAANQFGMKNMDALNQFALEQGRMTQQNQQFNAGQTNSTNVAQAGLLQQAGLASMDAYNTMYGQNFSADQSTRIANLDAKLKQGQLNDDQYRALLAMEMAQNEADRQAAMEYERMAAAQASDNNKSDERAYEASTQRQKDTASAVLDFFTAKGAASAAGGSKTSDEKSKADIKPMSSMPDRTAAPKGAVWSPELGHLASPSEATAARQSAHNDTNTEHAGDAKSKAFRTPEELAAMQPKSSEDDFRDKLSSLGSSGDKKKKASPEPMKQNGVPDFGSGGRASFAQYLSQYGNAVSDPGAKSDMRDLSRALKKKGGR